MDAILQRKHKLDGVEVVVNIYLELLVGNGKIQSASKPKFKVPDALQFTSVNTKIVEFLQRSKEDQDELRRKLRDHHAELIISDGGVNCISLNCLLTKDTDNCITLAKTWEDVAEKELMDGLGLYGAEKIHILQETWDEVC